MGKKQNIKKGRLFVISAPSGAGKTSLVKELMHGHQDICASVSYTTRPMRDGERDGKDYVFVSKQEFQKMAAAGDFLEHAVVFGNHYGTARAAVDALLSRGKNVILEIDWQGACQVRDAMPECVSIFVLPPSKAELERRLRDRATDTDEAIALRLRDAVEEMSHWSEFDFVVINDNFGEALDELLQIIRGGGERSRADRTDLRPLVGALLAPRS